MVLHCLVWTSLVLIGSASSCMILFGPVWHSKLITWSCFSCMDLNCFLRFCIVLCGALWPCTIIHHLVKSFLVLYGCTDLYGLAWLFFSPVFFCLTLNADIWYCMFFYGLLRSFGVRCGLICVCIILYDLVCIYMSLHDTL